MLFSKLLYNWNDLKWKPTFRSTRTYKKEKSNADFFGNRYSPVGFNWRGAGPL
jgi:hypothetical protein